MADASTLRQRVNTNNEAKGAPLTPSSSDETTTSSPTAIDDHNREAGAGAGAPLRPVLSRTVTTDSPTSSYDLTEEEVIFSGLPLLDLFVLLDAHLELATRSIRKRSATWKSKADKLVEESRARAQKIKLPRVKSDVFSNTILSGDENGMLSGRDRERLERRIKEVRMNAKEQMRRLTQKWEEEKTVRLRDKISFFSGVMNVLISALLLGFRPTWIPAWYTAQVMAYLPLRVYSYKKRSYHYFLFDLCYAINGLCLVYLWILPGNVFLFQACYGLALGSLGTAIATWRNSLVFHSLDKVISLAIHIFPPFVFTTIRHFYPNAEERYPALLGLPDLQSWQSRWKCMGVCMFVYLIWQALYFQYVIVARKEKIKQGRATSFTFLINDRKRLIGKIAAKVPEGRREATFMFGQAVYTFVTLLIPIWGLYDSKFWSSVYLLVVFGISVWNGANFYLEVFARKFEKELIALRKEFEQQQEMLSQSVGGGGSGTSQGMDRSASSSGSNEMSRSTSQVDLPTTVAEEIEEVADQVDNDHMDGEGEVVMEGQAGQDVVMVEKGPRK